MIIIIVKTFNNFQLGQSTHIPLTLRLNASLFDRIAWEVIDADSWPSTERTRMLEQNSCTNKANSSQSYVLMEHSRGLRLRKTKKVAFTKKLTNECCSESHESNLHLKVISMVDRRQAIVIIHDIFLQLITRY